MGQKRPVTRQATPYSEHVDARLKRAQDALQTALTTLGTKLGVLQLLEDEREDAYVSEELARARRDADVAAARVERAQTRVADLTMRQASPTLPGLD